MLVLGVDSGTHTGCAILDTEEALVDSVNLVRERTFQFIGRDWRAEVDVAQDVVDLILERGIHVLAMEDFMVLEFNNSERSGISPARVSAAIDALLVSHLGKNYGVDSSRCGEDGYVYRRTRMASMAKTTWTDERLKRVGRWNGLSAHERDAWRHALLFARTAGILKK